MVPTTASDPADQVNIRSVTEGTAMCLTDATNIITNNHDAKKKKAALRILKEKMKKRRKYLAERIADIDRGLQAIEKMSS